MDTIENNSIEKHILTEMSTAATFQSSKAAAEWQREWGVRRGKHEKCGIHFASGAPAAGVQSVQWNWHSMAIVWAKMIPEHII